jgi:hypothetical protein
MAAQIVDKEVSTSDIIRKDLERGGFTKEENRFLMGLKQAIQDNKAVVVRDNNTVFVGLRTEPGTLEVHMYTIDSPNMLAGAIKVGIDTVKKAGVKKLVGETDNFKLVAMLERMRLPVEVDKNGKMFTWSMEIK